MKKTTQEILEDIFRELQTRVEQPSPRLRIALISTPRSGSSMFCDTLTNTGNFGQPFEWFNIRYLKAWASVLGVAQLDFTEYVNWVVARTTSSNGIFSVNFHVEQFYQLLQQSKINVMQMGFDRVYYLERNDKLAQAYSLHRAQVTDQWSSEAEPLQEFDVSDVRNSDVLKALLHIATSEDIYNEHLAQHVNHTFCYEDFCQLDTTKAFATLWEDCGISDPLPVLETGMTRQSGNKEPAPLSRVRQYLSV